MPKFSVTYERWNEADIEAGDTDDRGFVIEDCSLRDAVQLGLEAREPSWLGHCEPSDSRPGHAHWLSFHKWNDGTREYYETGVVEDRALHIPDSVTTASRKRIARLFGVN